MASRESARHSRQATAPALRQERPAGEASPEVATAAPRVATQTTLSFSREGQKVVAIGDLPPARTARRRQAQRTVSNVAEPQQRFTFDVPAAAPPPAGVLFSNANVATPLHRSVAALLDLAMMLIGAALTLVAIYWSGAEIPLTNAALPVWGGIAGLVALTYRLLWCFCGADAPGFRWTGLRTLNFDGNPPTGRQRVYRLLGGFLSTLAAGLGLLWALADEEKLTWHDHISQTFPAVGGRVTRR